MKLLTIFPSNIFLQESFEDLQFEIENYIEYLGHSIECLLELKTGDRFLRFQDSIFNSMTDLIYFFPEITNSVLVIAKLLNFLISNNNDQVIDNPQEFIEKYNYLYTSEFVNYHYHHLSAYNHYDISTIKSPEIKKKKLIYYLDRKGIPYKVSCEWPIISDTPILKYEILNSID